MWDPSLPSARSRIRPPQCRTSKEADQISSYLRGYRDAGTLGGCFLGFNEPDIADQANLSVEEAVGLWREYVVPREEGDGRRAAESGESGGVECGGGGEGEGVVEGVCGEVGGAGGVWGSDFVVIHWYGA